MDIQTLNIYIANASKFAEQYDSCNGGISAYFAEAFGDGVGINTSELSAGKSKSKTDPQSGQQKEPKTDPSSYRILDIGCGSGRDLNILHEMGFQADGVDPCKEFVKGINRDLNRSLKTSEREHSRTPALLDPLNRPHRKWATMLFERMSLLLQSLAECYII